MEEFIDSDENKNVALKINIEESTEGRKKFNQKYNYNKINSIEISNNKSSDITFNKIDLSNSNISQNPISLLTYNFFCRPPPIKTNKSDYKDARLLDFFQQLENYDIICFQELFTTLNDRKHKMIQEGSRQGLKYYLTAKVPSFFSRYLIDSGLLILSRYRIIDHDFYEYYMNISGDAPSNKGVLYAKIEIKKHLFLFLFNTHLQSSYFDDKPENIDTTIQIRTKQTEELINFIYNKILTIPEKEILNGKIILCGDFNIDAHDNVFAQQRYNNIPKYKYTEYEILNQKLNKLGQAIDLMKKKYNKHLYTFGDNSKIEYDKVLTGKADYNLKQCLDYIWEIIPDYNLDIYNEIKEDDNNKNIIKDKIEVLYDTLKVEEFLVKNKPYQQLSDHFGISVHLAYS